MIAVHDEAPTQPARLAMRDTPEQIACRAVPSMARIVMTRARAQLAVGDLTPSAAPPRGSGTP